MSDKTGRKEAETGGEELPGPPPPPPKEVADMEVDSMLEKSQLMAEKEVQTSEIRAMCADLLEVSFFSIQFIRF